MIVATSLLVLLVGLIVLLSFTVFSLKSVEVSFRTSHYKITSTEEEIIEEGEFKMGGSVFLQKKSKHIERIENSNPYIKVINIETVFPSKLVIHIAERQEVYAIPIENGHYICDEELRVLKISTDFVSTSSNAMLLNLSSPLTQNSLQVGDYIEGITVPPIYEALFENNRTLGEQTELIESITISSELNSTTKKEETIASLKLFSGQTVRIVNTSHILTAKINLMLKAYSQLFNNIGKTHKGVVLTEENLKTCTIEINNYLHPDKMNECYADIII